METSKVSSCNEDNDITTCTICLEQFSIPKYLPCLHTFCESCIAIYITSSYEKDKTSIDCPVCRAKVSAPDANITPEEWSKQMPLNFLIVGLIEKHKVERTEKICMSCERSDVNTKSEASSVCIDCSDALCANCTRCHKSNKLSSNHEIVPISDISRGGYVLKAFKNMCAEHKNKELELFCVDHEFPCCSICVSVKHRKCENVLTIEEAAKNFRALNSVSKTQNEISSLLADFDTVLESERSSLVDMEANYDNEMQRCILFWQNLQQRIEELKNKSIKECQKVFNSEKSRLEFTIRDVENRKKEVTNTKQILEVTLKEASDVQLMIEVQKLNKNIEKQFRNFDTSVETYKIKIHFQKCLDDIVKIFEDNFVINNEKTAKDFDLSSSKLVYKEMEPESLEEMEPESLEKMEPVSLEEMEPVSLEKMEPESLEEMKPLSLEEIEAESLDDSSTDESD
ncbi:E3 ubiquitin-protein ligase TRIM45-like [Mytilus edulis]|uniref:E3 ubiquitin-protein ligase TRIM45-like n=1 Tax=Mytilus edulis TaxID=6550 RepID=UPI0039F0A577